MDSRLDKKTRDHLINAIQGAKAYHRQLEMKREQRLWKHIEIPCTLFNLLSLCTKNELDTIRKKLDLKGISSLKKAELAGELERLIPVYFEKVLSTFDQERYELIRGMIKNSAAMPIHDEFPLSKIESLMGFGIIFPVIHNKQKLLTIPVELTELFAKMDGTELQETIHRNTEWIRLTHGMLYFYGVFDTSKILDKLSTFTKKKVDVLEFLNVFSAASDYYQQARFSSNGTCLEDHRVFLATKIIEEHKARPNVDYYPFTKKQLLKAGDSGFIDKTPAMEKFLQFLLQHYDLNEQETDEIALQLINMINKDAKPSVWMQFLQSQLEFPSFEFVQLLTAQMMEVYNNTRMWVLKGYTPDELHKKEKQHLNPIPPSMKKQTGSNIIDINSRKKTGRNDPCPCGSGKKYKKCCGKHN